MNTNEFKIIVSEYASKGIPFLFIIDFELQKPMVYKLEEAGKNQVYFDFKAKSNITPKMIDKEVCIKSNPIERHIFEGKFNRVQDELKGGYTYLLNLTFPTRINTNLSLEEVFHKSQAPYKLLYKDDFVVFSPECFIKIENNKIFTYPMKGTIDANVEDAENILINNPKETWEHNTIVDLMRNDLSLIAQNIAVEKYRYVQKIDTHKGAILQTSSQISGNLKENWRETLGEDILKLLPAGSISGAPKQKTVQIIEKNEIIERGFYTGVFGIFDGKDLDSAVAIRFIENRDGEKLFRSGGGITEKSNADEEYNELIQKIYIPTKKDYPLFETICLRDGIIQNIEYHIKRFSNTYRQFYGNTFAKTIFEDLSIPDSYKKGVIKMRISYNAKEKKVEYESYNLKEIKTLKIVYDNAIDYSFKYTNRSPLNCLYNQRGNCDDVLIVKDGLVTDSSYSNIVFFDGNKWITPSTPLLKGTAREKLIHLGIVKEQRIPISDLSKFKKFKLINAMRDFETIEESDIENIVM